METTRAEASNAEACHAEATNNYTLKTAFSSVQLGKPKFNTIPYYPLLPLFLELK